MREHDTWPDGAQVGRFPVNSCPVAIQKYALLGLTVDCVCADDEDGLHDDVVGWIGRIIITDITGSEAVRRLRYSCGGTHQRCGSRA